MQMYACSEFEFHHGTGIITEKMRLPVSYMLASRVRSREEDAEGGKILTSFPLEPIKFKSPQRLSLGSSGPRDAPGVEEICASENPAAKFAPSSGLSGFPTAADKAASLVASVVPLSANENRGRSPCGIVSRIRFGPGVRRDPVAK